MQATSRAYKTEQKQHLREKSHVYVYLGVISRGAQRTARITTEVTEWSQLPTSNVPLEGVYATYEENFMRCDGSQLFPPKNNWAMYQGAASADIGGAMTFVFDNVEDIKGITLKFFDDAIPLRFRIENGLPRYTREYEYSVDDLDDNHYWSCEDEFGESSYIKITPLELQGGNQRLRIQEIMFGKGFYFKDEQLISTARKNTVAHLSDKLPSKSFTFTIDNLNKKFASDDPHSFVHFLQEQQEVFFDYGRDLPDGSTYAIKGGKVYLKTWSNDDQKATFNTVGYLDFMDTTYYKGHYEPDGITLYDLAVEVFEDAGIENYHIDSFLKRVTTHNPLPVEKHKNLLQLIANAAMCIFYEDRNGDLTIGGSFESEIVSLTANSETDYSNLEKILEKDGNVGEYASYEKNFFRADGSQFFLPVGTNYIDCGYVSDVKANASGNFTTDPAITIIWEATWTWYNMALRFGGAVPKGMTITLYKDDVETDSFDVDPETIDKTTLIEHDFYDVNKMVLTFTKAEPHQRIHLNKMEFGKITDYTITYSDMAKPPVAATTEFVKNVVCHYYEFAYGTEEKQIGSFEAYVGENLITFDKPCHNVSVAYESGSGTINITESAAYYVKFTASDAGKVEITGREYAIVDSELMQNIRTIGVDKTSKNILLDNRAFAQRNLGWLADFYKNDVEYAVTYRGEPAIDCDDQIYLENKYVSKNLVRVLEESLSTAQGMSLNCSLKARRISYKEPAKVDYAITDISEVE